MQAGTPDRSEFRKAFGDAVGHARTYLVRSVIILILLIVVVEDRLTVRRRDESDTIERLEKINSELRVAKDRVGQKWKAVDREYTAVTRCIALPNSLELTVRNLPTTPGAVDSGESLKEVDRLAKAFRARAKTLAKRTGCDPEVIGAFAKRGQLSIVQEMAGLSKKGELSKRVDLLAKELEDYSREYRDQTAVWAEKNPKKQATEAELTELTRKASSLPRPFGGFDVIPGLALVGLVFGVFGSYVGVHVWINRLRTVARRFAARRMPNDGTLANCGALPALFVDLDFSGEAHAAAGVTEVDARQRLADVPLPPSLVVQSGGGLQAWWFLKEPIDLQAEAAEAKTLLRRLARRVPRSVQPRSGGHRRPVQAPVLRGRADRHTARG